LIGQKPDFLVLDDIFASVDKETRAYIIEQLSLIADETLFIQIFYRKADILNFIHTVVVLDEFGKIRSVVRKEDFSQKHQTDNIRQQSFELPYCLHNSEPVANPLISLKNVSLSYGEKKVLNGISWTIRLGEFWQLTGPIGSGKSSLLSMIVGDNPKGYGQDITLFGRKKGSGESIWDIKRHIGYFTPSMLAQFKRNESVEHMIISGMVDSVGLYIKPTDLQIQTARKWLNLLGDSYRDKKFMQLSYNDRTG
jgi:molybdate transport system ATP-binding protein